MTQIAQRTKDLIRQELLEEQYQEQQYETLMRKNSEYCANHFNLQELADKFKTALTKANTYGHNFQINDFIIN